MCGLVLDCLGLLGAGDCAAHYRHTSRLLCELMAHTRKLRRLDRSHTRVSHSSPSVLGTDVGVDRNAIRTCVLAERAGMSRPVYGHAGCGSAVRRSGFSPAGLRRIPLVTVLREPRLDRAGRSLECPSTKPHQLLALTAVSASACMSLCASSAPTARWARRLSST